MAGARSKHGGPLSWDKDIWPSLCELLGGSVAALWDATARFDEELAGVLAEARSAPRSAALEQLRAATARHTRELGEATAQTESALSSRRAEALLTELSPSGGEGGAPAAATPDEFHARMAAAVEARCERLRVPLAHLRPVAVDTFAALPCERAVAPLGDTVAGCWRAMQDDWAMYAAGMLARRAPRRAGDGRADGGGLEQDAQSDAAAPAAVVSLLCQRADLSPAEAAATAVPFEVSVTLLDPARDPTAAAAASGRYLLLREMALSPRTADPLGAGVVVGGAGSGVALVSESVRGRSVGMMVRKHGPMLPADPLARSVMAEALGWAIDVVDQCRGRLRLPSAAEDLFVVADEGMRVAAVGAELEAWPVSGCSEGAALRDCNLSTAVGACSALLQVLIAEPSPPRRGATDGEKVRDAPSRELHLYCSDPAEGGAAAGGAPRLPDTLWLCQGDRLVLRGAATASTVAGNGAALRVVGGAGEEEGQLVLVGAAPGAVSVAIRDSAGAEPAILRVQVVPLAAGRWVSMAASALRTGEERLLRAVAAFLQAEMPELDDVADAYHAWLARQPAGE